MVGGVRGRMNLFFESSDKQVIFRIIVCHYVVYGRLLFCVSYALRLIHFFAKFHFPDLVIGIFVNYPRQLLNCCQS